MLHSESTDNNKSVRLFASLNFLYQAHRTNELRYEEPITRFPRRENQNVYLQSYKLPLINLMAYYDAFINLIYLNVAYIPETELTECNRLMQYVLDNAVSGAAETKLLRKLHSAALAFTVLCNARNSTLTLLNHSVLDEFSKWLESKGYADNYNYSNNMDLVRRYKPYDLVISCEKSISLSRSLLYYDAPKYRVEVTYDEAPEKIKFFEDIINWWTHNHSPHKQYFIHNIILNASDRTACMFDFFRAYFNVLNRNKESALDWVSFLLEKYISFLIEFKRLLTPNILNQILTNPGMAIIHAANVVLWNDQKKCKNEYRINDPDYYKKLTEVLAQLDAYIRLCSNDGNIYFKDASTSNYLTIVQLFPQNKYLFKAVRSIPFSATDSVPFMLEFHLTTFNWEVCLAFKNLNDKAASINDRADVNNKRNLFQLYIEYQPVIYQIIEIMKIDGVQALSSTIEESLVPFERFLAEQIMLPPKTIELLTNFYRENRDAIQSSQENRGQWQDLYKLVNTYYAYESMLRPNRFDSNSEELNSVLFTDRNISLNSIHHILHKLLVLFIPSRTIDAASIDKLTTRFSIDQICRVITATPKLKQYTDTDLFIKMIEVDLFGGSIESILNDKNNRDFNSKNLAAHNAMINDILHNENINVRSALDYKKTMTIKVVPDFIDTTNPLVSLPSNPSYKFTIKQWDKRHADTFFLGDQVGSSLASNATEFYAMVQRRMDNAMLLHVAIDEATGKVAGILSLYLAQKNNGEIVLVADCLELHHQYSSNENLRVSILQALLQFTHQYCLDNPHIKHFQMLNMGDLNSYPNSQDSIVVDKVGGGLYLNGSYNKKACSLETTCNLYHLKSLGNQVADVRNFNPDVLTRKKLSCWCETDKSPRAGRLFSHVETVARDVVRTVFRQGM